MGVSSDASRAQAGARAGRAARKNRRGAERCRGAIAGSPHARGYPLSISGSSLPPAPFWSSVLALLIQRIAPSVGLSDSIPTLRCSRYLALTLACLGYIDQARSRMDEALSEARRLRHAHTLAHVLGRCELDRLAHLLARWMHIEELLALSTEHGFPLLFGLGHWHSADGR